MAFNLPKYVPPDFTKEPLISSPDALTQKVLTDGAAPVGFHATTIFPEYIKLDGQWYLIKESRMDCVMVVEKPGVFSIKEFRTLKPGDQVIIGRSEDGSEGIYIHTRGFKTKETQSETFTFRTGRSRETSFSMDYDQLYERLVYEKNHGYAVWVLGPAVVFDSDSRDAVVHLINNGYIHAVLAGNALAVHDLEAALFSTALGQEVYSQIPISKGHYHHLDVINRARKYPSLKEFIKEENINTGIMHACIMNNIPFVLAGSIRDDGPLPSVIKDVYEAQNAMREHTRKATTLLGLATQLHTIAAGNMTPSYHVELDDSVRPVFIYSVDISEFVVNKLKDRGSLAVTSIVTNIQDFLVHISRNI